MRDTGKKEGSHWLHTRKCKEGIYTGKTQESQESERRKRGRLNVKPEMEDNAKTKRRIDKVAHSRRKSCQEKKGEGWGRLQRGKSCRQRVEYRGKTQGTEAGITLREAVKERIENEGLIVNGRVALKNPKVYVGMKEREGMCVGKNISD